MKKFFFLSQGNTLDLFYDVYNNLLDRHIISSKSCFTISDNPNYKKFIKKNKSFIQNKDIVKIRDWDILSYTNNDVNKSLEIIDEYQKKFNKYNLYRAINSDRGLVYSNSYKYKINYNSNVSFDKKIIILSNYLLLLDDTIKILKPDYTLSFQCNTVADYLMKIFCYYYDIKTINLKPSKIFNYLFFSSDIYDPCSTLINSLNNKITQENKLIINNFIEGTRKKKIYYEGVIKNNSGTQHHISYLKIFNIRKYFKYLKKITIINNEKIYDFHKYNHFYSFLFLALINKIKFKYQNIFFLNKKYIEKQKNKKYIFFPLHAEPEVSLLVYSYPFLNQLEILRYISLQTPINYEIIVKEHPWMTGKRKNSFYKKILSIPKCKLINPYSDTNKLIKNVDLVAVLSSSVGFEAAILKKPVITFGHTYLNLLPENMVKNINNIKSIYTEIVNLENNYNYNNDEITKLINALISNSINIDFYSVLLKRNLYYNLSKSSKEKYQNDLNKFLSKIIKIFND